MNLVFEYNGSDRLTLERVEHFAKLAKYIDAAYNTIVRDCDCERSDISIRTEGEYDPSPNYGPLTKEQYENGKEYLVLSMAEAAADDNQTARDYADLMYEGTTGQELKEELEQLLEDGLDDEPGKLEAILSGQESYFDEQPAPHPPTPKGWDKV